MACPRSRLGDQRPERKAAGADVSRAAGADVSRAASTDVSKAAGAFTPRQAAPRTLVAASATARLLEGFTRIE